MLLYCRYLLIIFSIIDRVIRYRPTCVLLDVDFDGVF